MRHKILSVIIALVLVVAIGGALGGSQDEKRARQTGGQTEASTGGSQQSAPEAKKEEKKERLTLDEGWSLDKSNPYATKVIGTVSNNSDKAIDGYIQIRFSGLDAEGANVGDCLANANTVNANGKWKFEAICFDGNKIDKVQFKDLTGF